MKKNIFLYFVNDIMKLKMKGEKRMIKFTWYEFDWKEDMDMDYVKYLEEQVGGKRLVTELSNQGDSYEYCIHSHDVPTEVLEILREIRCFDEEDLEDSGLSILKGKLKNKVLSLQSEEELYDVLVKIKGDDNLSYQVKKEEYTYNISDVETLQNEEGWLWHVINEKGQYFDFVAGEYQNTSTVHTYLFHYELALDMIKRYELESVKFKKIKVEK